MKLTRASSGLHVMCLILSLTILAWANLLTVAHNTPHFEPQPFGQASSYDSSHLLTSASFPFRHLQVPGADTTPFAHLRWEHQIGLHSWNSQTPFSINTSQGMLSRDTLHFTRIEPEPIQVVVEDYNPANCPFEDYIWNTEISFMSFVINGTDAVRVDGFSIYLRGESKGIFRYRIYGAQPGMQAVTFVNEFAPVTDWIEHPISPMLLPGQERWLWIDTNESELILNPETTYQNTFYFALARAYDDDTLVNWVYCRDDANPDEEDEGDCYGYFSSYNFRPRDLFLNVSILPENPAIFPTDINMTVNGADVTDLSSPSKGLWDSGEFLPPLVVNGESRDFLVTSTWPNFYQWSLEFDVVWTGSLQEVTSTIAGPDFTSGHLEVNVVLTMIIDFPKDVVNQTILTDLDPDWVVHFVTRNTLIYEDWQLIDTAVLISNAEDGLWAIYCTAPLSPFTLFGNLIPWIVVIFIVVFMVLFLFYRQQILLPKQRTRRRLLQSLAESFSDIEKIRRILLIHKETGLCLLDPIVDRSMNANLVTALIQAITTFGISLTEPEDSYGPVDDGDTPLREIKYRDFHIIVHDGKYMRNAIIFKQPPSDQLHERLEQFTTAFEEQYADVLENWAGRLNIFGEAIDLVDQYFFISFRLPYVVQDASREGISLSRLEQHLFESAKALSASQNSFFIRDLVDKYQKESDWPSLDVFEAIFRLKQTQLIVPLQTHIPYTLENHNNAGS